MQTYMRGFIEKYQNHLPYWTLEEILERFFNYVKEIESSTVAGKPVKP